MNHSAIIEAEKSRLVDWLDSSFRESRPESFRALVLSTEPVLQVFLKSCLVRYADQLLGATRIDVRKQSIFIHGRQYNFQFARTADPAACLEVRLIPCGRKASSLQVKYNCKHITIGAPCQYSKVVYRISTQWVLRDWHLIQELTRAVFITGNNWAEAEMLRHVREASDVTGRRMYDQMRKVVDDKRVLTAFVFSELSNDLDRVVPDEEATRAATSLAARSARKLGRSPVDVTAQAMM